MITEDAARTKWCPFSRTMISIKDDDGETVGYNVANRGTIKDTVMKNSRCLGSSCIAWRWADERNPDWKPSTGMMWPDTRHPDDILKPWRPSKTHGYCGLAGRP